MNRISDILFLLTIFFVLGLSALLWISPELYSIGAQEDHLFEYSTSIFFFISALFLLSIFFRQKEKSRKLGAGIQFLLVFLSILFIFAGGEEISWGQRIFGWGTPEYVGQINQQNETNLHNINKTFFDRAMDRSTILFVFTGLFLLYRKKPTILGMPSPGMGIICSFSITTFYQQYVNYDPNFYQLQFIPLILYAIYSILKKNKKHLAMLSVTLLIATALPFYHFLFHDFFAANDNLSDEYSEFLFAMSCAFYSLYIAKFFSTPPKNSEFSFF